MKARRRSCWLLLSGKGHARQVGFRQQTQNPTGGGLPILQAAGRQGMLTRRKASESCQLAKKAVEKGGVSMPSASRVALLSRALMPSLQHHSSTF